MPVHVERAPAASARRRSRCRRTRYAGTYEIVRQRHARAAREGAAGARGRRASASRRSACRCCARGCRPVGTPLVGPADVAPRRAGELPRRAAAPAACRRRCARRSTPRSSPSPTTTTSRFAGGDVEGRAARSRATRFARFDGYRLRRSGHGRAGRRRAARRAKRGTDLPLTLDAAGGARATRRRTSAASDVPRDLVAELEYRDPNGETLTAATRVPLWPSRIVLGHQAGRLGREQGPAQVHRRRARRRPASRWPACACAPTRSSATTTRIAGG